MYSQRYSRAVLPRCGSFENPRGVELDSRRIEDYIEMMNEKQRGRRIKRRNPIENSNFYITINTQGTDLGLREKLKEAFNEFYENLEAFIYFRRPGDGLEKIDKIECRRVAIEVGKKYHRVHLHCLLSITHRSNIQLNLKMMKEHFESYTGRGNIHLNVEYIEDPLFFIEEYIRKQVE